VVETGEYKGEQPSNVDQRHNALLFAHFFPELHPSLDQLRIVFVEIAEAQKAGSKPNGDINPALPKLKRASGDKQQSTDHNHPNQEPKGQSRFESHRDSLPYFE
jgi:hypothetical protein